MSESLSLRDARKLVLLSQRVPPKKQSGSAAAATLSAIEHLGYIQIDTISVIQRAHHHTLWNRNPRYQATQLDQLLSEKRVFEYWAHAAAYLPFRDFRFSLVRKQAFASGKQKHWYRRDEPMLRRVLKRITAEGPLMARDFEGKDQSGGAWKAKPAKRALEYLFMQGDLMVPCRVGFQKVYDLTERVVPEGTDTSVPDSEEYARFLITGFLRAHGLGQAAEMAYLRDGTSPLIQAALQEMVASGEVLSVHVDDQLYYVLPESLELLSRPLARSKLRILSPFDNLVIQRKRMKRLFDFDYLIECYLPEARRQYGYFSLPMLWDARLVGRMDCRVDRSESCLHLLHVALEPGVAKVEVLFDALSKELQSFLKFNNCTWLQLHRTSPATHRSRLQAVLKAAGQTG